ncbi:MAG: hypothetical protein KAI43_13485 [Candidatus Aureabacteria bacterium]|nr:hypothetical protein [Candidatus Auribacterota bacterium]
MKSLNKSFASCLLLIICLCISGCGDFHIRDRVAGALSKKYVVDNYYVDDVLVEGVVRRVLFVPCKDISGYQSEDFLSEIDSVFLKQLRRSKKFDIVPYEQVLNEEQKKFIDSMDIERKGSYDADTLYEIGRKVNVQGILFGSISEYNPKKPILLGVKINLIHIRRGTIVWAVDEIFDAARDDIKNLARAYYYENYDTSLNPSLKWEFILNSMKDFSNFYFYEMIKTFSPKAPLPQQ